VVVPWKKRTLTFCRAQWRPTEMLAISPKGSSERWYSFSGYTYREAVPDKSRLNILELSSKSSVFRDFVRALEAVVPRSFSHNDGIRSQKLVQSDKCLGTGKQTNSVARREGKNRDACSRSVNRRLQPLVHDTTSVTRDPKIKKSSDAFSENLCSVSCSHSCDARCEKVLYLRCRNLRIAIIVRLPSHWP